MYTYNNQLYLHIKENSLFPVFRRMTKNYKLSNKNVLMIESEFSVISDYDLLTNPKKETIAYLYTKNIFGPLPI